MTQPAPLCLITRPEPNAQRFASRVQVELRLPTLVAPLMRIESVELSDSLDSFGGVILTSAHAARLLAALGVPTSTPCFAVGKKTAHAAEKLGYTAHAMGGDADKLVAALISNPRPGPLVHLRGEHTRGDVAARLTLAGVPTSEKVVYRQVSQGLSRSSQQVLTGKQAIILPLFSPRTAKLALAEFGTLRGLVPVALSDAVAQAAQFPGAYPTVTAREPTEDDMIAAIAQTSPARAWVEKAGLQS